MTDQIEKRYGADMQKNENHSGELDKKLVAVWGPCCEGCTLFIATKEDTGSQKGVRS